MLLFYSVLAVLRIQEKIKSVRTHIHPPPNPYISKSNTEIPVFFLFLLFYLEHLSLTKSSKLDRGFQPPPCLLLIQSGPHMLILAFL